MKYAVIAIGIALMAGCSSSGGLGGGDQPLTRAEATDFAETSRYADVVTFLETVTADASALQLTTFGETVEGRVLPLIVWGAEGSSAEAVRATEKTRVLVFANIHAGEVCGKEALQMLARDLAQGQHAAWADSLVLLVAPIYNADGNERVALDNRPGQLGPIGGMGQRPNAQGLDLNRDFMKLAAPESRALVALMDAYDPHVVVDLHTTNGTIHAYHLTYAPPLNPNTPAAIDEELRDRWLPAVAEQIAEEDGWAIEHYGNVPGAFGEATTAPRAWYTFDGRPRFGTNYAGLRNRFGILSEAYSYASFEERVRATKRFVEEVVDYAHAHASRIRMLTGEADATSIVGDSLSLRATWDALPAPVEIMLGEADTVYHPVTNAPMLQRRDTRISETMPALIRFTPIERERVPVAYLVPPSLTEVVELLDGHGIHYTRGTQPTPIEIFEVDSVTVAQREFQGRRSRTLHGYYATLDDASPAEMLIVPLDQPLGRLAFMLLEPRSDDGIVAWAALREDHLQAGRTYPIRRIPSPQPRR
ncbi:MAG: M14 family metallopeptidase [Rhodothermaceae bacterium]|nr:M14 family metallopeptidase [Rhodothermaceae bacterium]